MRDQSAYALTWRSQERKKLGNPKLGDIFFNTALIGNICNKNTIFTTLWVRISDYRFQTSNFKIGGQQTLQEIKCQKLEMYKKSSNLKRCFLGVYGSELWELLVVWWESAIQEKVFFPFSSPYPFPGALQPTWIGRAIASHTPGIWKFGALFALKKCILKLCHEDCDLCYQKPKTN